MIMADRGLSSQTTVFILAGGIGRRLSPLTDLRPKPAVSFAGIFRIIDFTLANCRASGINSVSLLTQYRHEQLREYVRTLWDPFWNERRKRPAQLTCLPPTRNNGYKGTADAVLQNLSILKSKTTKHTVVLSGDHVYYMDYRKLLQFHTDSGADLTIAATERSLEAAKHFGVLDTDINHRVIEFAEKPAQPKPMAGRPGRARISMGIYVFSTEVLLDALHDICLNGPGSDFGHDVIPSLVKSSHVSAYDFRGYWRDIGSIESYYRASMDLLNPNPQFNPYVDNFQWCPGSGRYGRLLNVEKLEQLLRAQAFANPLTIRSVTSAAVQIDEDALIEDSVLLPGAHIGKAARLRRVIVDEGVEIPEHCEIGWDLDQDRELYTVTPTGIVVVSQTPKTIKPATIVTFEPPHARRKVKRVEVVKSCDPHPARSTG
jgi:glucose-1-phosphate adenylyltransferase